MSVTTVKPASNRPLAPAANKPVPQTPAPTSAPVAFVQEAGKGLLAKLNDGLLWLIQGASMAPMTGIKVLEDPSARWPTSGQKTEASAYVAGHATEERDAVARLGTRAAAYETIAVLLDGEKQPCARAALMRLLLEGKLAGAKDLHQEGDVLDHLTAIATRPLAPNVDRAQLLQHLVQELENPVKIAQGGKSTCTATACTMIAARKNPAEVARLVAGLAMPAGTVALSTGKAIAREPDWGDSGDGGRTVSMRLLQPALMEWGNGLFGYDNNKDADTLFGKELWLAGLSGGATREVAEALTGDKYSAHTLYRWSRGHLLKKLEQAVAAGKPVPVSMVWEEGGQHQLVVEAIRGKDVILLNPGGSRVRLDLEKFRAAVLRLHLPK